MAGRIRSIKPEILDDEETAAMSDEAWRLWVSSWLLADDCGNCRAGDKYLAALVWQDTSRSPRVAAILREMQKARRIEVYENNGERYMHIRNWEKHQRIDNAGKPRVPSVDDANSKAWEQSLRESPRVSESVGDSRLDQRPPTNDPDLFLAQPTASRVRFDFDALYDAYPNKKGKAEGQKKLKALVKTEAEFQAVKRGLECFLRDEKRKGTETQFYPHWSTWVNKRRWEDFSGEDVVSATPGLFPDGMTPHASPATARTLHREAVERGHANHAARLLAEGRA